MRIIDADKLESDWVDHFDSMYSSDCAKMFKRAIQEQPNVDTVKHGHWIETGKRDRYGNIEIKCSICHKTLISNIDCLHDELYCRHCGAKMDENLNGKED